MPPGTSPIGFGIARALVRPLAEHLPSPGTLADPIRYSPRPSGPPPVRRAPWLPLQPTRQSFRCAKKPCHRNGFRETINHFYPLSFVLAAGLLPLDDLVSLPATSSSAAWQDNCRQAFCQPSQRRSDGPALAEGSQTM